ncbi:MFS transporter [Collinsella intestinalis]|uniref:MFS transporter n=1 Tax=Collinsella intestinalis TaxID=147207 RepID=UPI00195C3507|nr:glycoside-pentoside-hexuronide (GPH):cation symporter [Collinsella intestinalis]MBM6907762.1 MFS transporter [Collinsella intestinalis]MBM6942329.1 MFS transporter [Collinsella intestinalis]
MAQQQATKLRKASLIEMLGFGFVGIGSNIPFVFMGSYLSFFYTDIFGLAPAIASGLMLASKIVDAIIDPFIGVVADRVNTKFGRYRPFLIVMAPFWGVCIWAVFSTPALDPTLKVIYACAAYILYVIISSFVIIPANSLASIITEVPKQRSTVQAIRQGCAVIPQLMSAFALPLVELCGGGQQGWSNYGIIMGAAVCLCYWAVAWTARTYDTPQLAQVEAIEASKEEGVSHKKKETFGDIVRSTIDTFKNRELLLLSGIFFASLASTGLSGAINMYYFTYVLGHQEWIVATTAFGVVTALLGPVLTPIVTNLWGKRRSMMIFAAAAIVPNLLVVFIPNPSVTILTLFISIANLFNGVVGTLMWAMIPDVVDWGEYNTGVRANGLAQAAVQLMNQFGQALGQALPVAVIGALGYVANQAQTPVVNGAIVALRWIAPCVLMLLVIVFTKMYRLTDERSLAISEELRHRHEAAETELAGTGIDE